MMDRRFSDCGSDREDILAVIERELSEERRRLLQERQEREGERRRGREETRVLRQNFVNLLTLAQYEHNRAMFEADESAARLTFNEKISQRSYLNFQHLRNFNFSQKARYSTLLQMIKSNFKGVEFSVRCENVFDCRPYNGPKTPPTPNVKLTYSKIQTYKQKTHTSNNCTVPFWSTEDMLFYLKKYKKEFKEYSESIDQGNKFSISPLNLFSKPKIINNKKSVNNDTEFYKDLIEKHKKSLEMIDNVGIQFPQSIPSTIIKSIESDTKKDTNLKNNNFSFDINQIRNQIYEIYLHYIMKNSITLNEEQFSQFCVSIMNSFNDQNLIGTPSNNASAQLTCEDVNPGVVNMTDFVGISASYNNDIKQDISDDPDDSVMIQMKDDPQHSITDESINAVNIYEDGEIIDSGDEFKGQRNDKIKIKSQKKLKKEEKKIEKKNKIIYKIDKSKLKSLATNKQRKIIIFPNYVSHYPRNTYSRIETERNPDSVYDENRNVDMEENTRYNERYRPYYSSYDRNRTYKRNIHEGNQYSYGSRYRYYDRGYYGGRYRYSNF